jgi:hypothetical protein
VTLSQRTQAEDDVGGVFAPHEELETRLAEALRGGYGFTIPKLVAPSAPRIGVKGLEVAPPPTGD